MLLVLVKSMPLCMPTCLFVLEMDIKDLREVCGLKVMLTHLLVLLTTLSTFYRIQFVEASTYLLFEHSSFSQGYDLCDLSDNPKPTAISTHRNDNIHDSTILYELMLNFSYDMDPLADYYTCFVGCYPIVQVKINKIGDWPFIIMTLFYYRDYLRSISYSYFSPYIFLAIYTIVGWPTIELVFTR